MSRITRLHYQDQDSAQTLAEALAEYYAGNAGVVSRPDTLPDESKVLFRNHDVCHVIFGLDTTMEDETIADTRTLLSCDVGFTRYANYLRSDTQARALFKEVGYLKVGWSVLKALPRIGRAIWAAIVMKRKWPWTAPAAFQARPISDLRREFGIHVF